MSAAVLPANTFNTQQIVTNPDTNIWNEILAHNAHSQQNTHTHSNIIVCSSEHSGVHTLLSKLNGIHNIQKTKHVDLLSYAYIKATKFHTDTDTNHTANIWLTTQTKHAAELLPTLIDTDSIGNTVYLICIDMSQPWSVPTVLTEWLHTIQQTQEKLLNKLTPEQQQQLKLQNSTAIQLYNNKSTTVNTALPEINLGCSICIVGCQTDQFATTLTGKQDGDTKFDYMIRLLRQNALKYGASLIMTSTANNTNDIQQNNVNIDLLYEYLYSTAFNKQHTIAQSPVVVGNDTSYNIYIPAGMDSSELIDSTYTGQISWFESADWNTVFANPTEINKHRRAQSIAVQQQSGVEFHAYDNDTLYKNIKFQLDNLVQSGSVGIVSPQQQQQRSTNSARQSLNAFGVAQLSPVAAQGSPANNNTTVTTTADKSPNNKLTTPLSPMLSANKRTTMDATDKAAAKSFFKNLLSSKAGAKAAATDTTTDKVRSDVENTVKKIAEKQ